MIEITHESETSVAILSRADYLLFDEKQRRVTYPGEFAEAGPNVFAIPAEDSDSIRRFTTI